MKPETIRIAEIYQNVYNGEPWSGSSLTEILKGVTPEQAYSRKAPGCHTIWEIVLHIIAWRKFTLKKLQNDSTFDIPLNSDSDWPPVKGSYESSWINTLNELELIQYQLVALIEIMDEYKLDELVPGKKYTFYHLLHGLIQHDLYHVAQISLLKKINSYSLAYVPPAPIEG